MSVKIPLIYVVDDDPVFLGIMAQVLKKFGMATEIFATTEEFLVRLKIQLPDLCFLDFNMEHKASGLELILKVRETFSKTLPLIVVTTESGLAQISQAIEMGADDYIFKPLNREVLSAKLLSHFITQELQFAKMADSTEIEMDIPLELSNTCEILQIDELGLSILSDHLLPKGMVIGFESEILQKIVGRPGAKILLTVVNSKLESQTPLLFQIDFEFDSTDAELLKAVRHWIVQSSEQPA